MNSNPTFQKDIFGKWILAGEHAVLRGSPALVFPLKGKRTRIGYQPTQQEIQFQLKGDSKTELDLILWGVLERALEKVGKTRQDLKGVVEIDCDIPLGAGLGASATLCVALAKWFSYLSFVQPEEEHSFSTNLENLFHGESSGVDTAVAVSGQGLIFERSGKRLNFAPSWLPHLYISYSGKRGVTKECVEKVKKLFNEDSNLAFEIDQKMKESVLICHRALEGSNQIDQLKEGMQMANECFAKWGLISSEIQNHQTQLRSAGALTTKPTGSGDGGYVLSLWPTPPSQELIARLGLIGCF